MLLSRSRPKSSMCQSLCFLIQKLQSLRHSRQRKRAQGSYVPCSHSPILPSLILGLLPSFFSITHDLICERAFLSLPLVRCFQVCAEFSSVPLSFYVSCVLMLCSPQRHHIQYCWSSYGKLVLKLSGFTLHFKRF